MRVSGRGILRETLGGRRGIVLAGVLGVAILAWLHLVRLAGEMGAGHAAMAAGTLRPWSAVDLLLLFAMWAVMMVAMMLPSAAPVILLYDAVARRRSAEGRPHAATGVFVVGYLAAWTGYAAVATVAQAGLHSAALLTPAMASVSDTLAGSLLVAAGLFQWTPLKHSCLRECRSPLGWLTAEWREGTRGALVMGVRHGAYCVGCCWALMALLFVAGVMNLLWIGALAALVLVEKAAGPGPRVARAAGVVLVGWGAWLLAGSPGA